MSVLYSGEGVSMIYMCYILVVLSIIKMIGYVRNFYVVGVFLRKAKKKKYTTPNNKKVLLLIPVLREQNVISQTLNHFMNMNTGGLELFIVVAGTVREGKTKEISTKEVVNIWIKERKFPENIKVFYSEADEVNGDRATQLNYAVNLHLEHYPDSKLDYIGVYDADSLPSLETLMEVAQIFNDNPQISACQQPVEFINAANRMASQNKSPLLVGNAIYQTMWTVIRELPSWIGFGYSKKDKLYKKNVYLIGHGEFLRYKTYKDFQFPEFEITDGIQLGYRMGMSNRKIMALSEFCQDDVPQNIKSLIQQHKRWYGGCMKLYSAYKWTQNNMGIKSRGQMIDGYWSQACWAWTAPLYILALIISICECSAVFYVLLVLVILYSYIFPMLSIYLIGKNVKIRLRDWLMIPFAIVIKSIGPNLYFLEKIFSGDVKYAKVER